MARRALAFRMKVIAYDPYITAESAGGTGVEIVPLEVLLAGSDFLTLHLPLSPGNEGPPLARGAGEDPEGGPDRQRGARRA